MIKKLFSMMLIAASLFAVSCDNDDDNNNGNSGDNSEVAYDGTMAITMVYYSQALSTSQSDVTYLLEQNDDSVTVTLSGVTFTSGLADAINALSIPTFTMDEDPYMPALTIVLPDIPKVYNGLYEIDSITPTTVDGEPFSTDTLVSVSDVSVTSIDDILTVSFNCVMSLYMGSETASEVTATILFTGDK